MIELKKSHLFNIDMHVHTAKFSECAESLDPLQIEEYARQAHVNAIVITDHDTLWDKQEFQELKNMFHEIQLYNGIEVTTENGYHLIIIGIKEQGPIHKGVTCNKAISYAHEQGGVAILAHPFRRGLPPIKIIAQVDAIEVGSTSLNEKESKLSINLAQAMTKPVIACSDAHSLPMIGWAYTSFPNRPENVSHLCEMIKKGLGKPTCPNPYFS